MPIKHVDEFLGLDIAVKSSTNPSLEGISGRIVGETMKTFSIKTSSAVKVVPKKGCVFRLRLASGEVVELNGDEVLKRVEERTWGYEAQ